MGGPSARRTTCGFSGPAGRHGGSAVTIELGGTYETRGGRFVTVTDVLRIPFTVGSEKRAWFGWKGLDLTDGTVVTWEANGRWSPAVNSPMDIIDPTSN